MADNAPGATTFTPSGIGFGCGAVGGLMITASPAERQRAVHCAVDAGVTYFDTAALYGQGTSEANLGQSLRGVKADVGIGTKVFVNTSNRSDIADAIERSTEESLRRLGVDTLTLLQLHNSIDENADAVSIHPNDVIDYVLPAFARLKKDGKTRFVGINGQGSSESILNVLNHGDIDTVQVIYNLLNPSAGQAIPAGYPAQDFRRMLSHLREKGISALGIRALAGGALTGSDVRHPVSAQVVDPLGSGPTYAFDVAQAQRFLPLVERGEASSLAELAIRYALSNADIASLVIGFSSLDQINEVLDWAALGPLSPSALTGIEEIRSGFTPGEGE